jgi:hypothetical protein
MRERAYRDSRGRLRTGLRPSCGMIPPQPGNTGWFVVEAESRDIATLLVGRDPTETEAAMHEANIRAIREAHRSRVGSGLVYLGGLFQTIEKASLFLIFSYPDVLA